MTNRPIIKLDEFSANRSNEHLEPSLSIRFDNFESANQHANPLSDEFIDNALMGNLRVGNTKTLFIKNYLDLVTATESDKELIGSPERIADLYARTSKMMERNLKISLVRDEDPVRAVSRRGIVKEAKDNFIKNLISNIGRVSEEIIGWCKNNGMKYPVKDMEYHGLTVDGEDILDSEGKGVKDLRPNFKIQRQFSASFIMAYSDKRVEEKMKREDKLLEKRIYLNPDIEEVPELFEKILQYANQSGIELQLKMLQRAPEAAKGHRSLSQNEELTLRGDGMVVYVGKKDANDVLSMVLALAKDNPQAFIGRETSRTPLCVADGISIGDEPTQAVGKSLTSHRAELIDYAINLVQNEIKENKIKKGEEARNRFRKVFKEICLNEGINPSSIAFNLR